MYCQDTPDSQKTTQNTENTQPTDPFSQDFCDSPMVLPWGRLCPNKPKFIPVGMINLFYFLLSYSFFFWHFSIF